MSNEATFLSAFKEFLDFKESQNQSSSDSTSEAGHDGDAEKIASPQKPSKY